VSGPASSSPPATPISRGGPWWCGRTRSPARRWPARLTPSEAMTG
jgi:hypothetical protein